MKVCTKCGESKSLEAFSRHRDNKDGRRGSCKTCATKDLKAWRKTSPKHREYVERHREANRKRLRAYYVANPEKVKAQARAWHEANRERARLNSQRYYQAHREELAEAMRRYYAEHRDEYIARTREWAQANPAKRREYVKRYDTSSNGRLTNRKAENLRRARRARVPTEDIDFQAVFNRDGGICGICGEDVNPDDWHLDHVHPLALGGPHIYDNVQVAHPSCNLRKGVRVSEGRVV